MYFNGFELFCFVVYIQIINNNVQKMQIISKNWSFEKICFFVYL